MNGIQLALKIVNQYNTTDVFKLARLAGVIVKKECWYPATWGEFDPISKNITINLNATIEPEIILAHELGHFFADKIGITNSESLAEEFQKTILKLHNL
jgi:Zn-dependent peptidase ImmA (M78 family)